jgi:Cu/Ag efflux protein CusF
MKIQSTLLLLSLAGGLAFAVSSASAKDEACPPGCDKPCCAAKADTDKACCAAKETACEGGSCASGAMAGAHKLTGQIVSIDTAKRLLVVKHEEIPGVMAAMTMGFTVPECCDISTLKKGDKIVGMMVKEGDKFLLKEPKLAAST